MGAVCANGQPSCPKLPRPASWVPGSPQPRGPAAPDAPLSSRRPWAPRSSLPRQPIKVGASHGLGPSLGRTDTLLKSGPGPGPTPRVDGACAFHGPRKHCRPSQAFVPGPSAPAAPRPSTKGASAWKALSRCDWAGQWPTRAGVHSHRPHGLAARRQRGLPIASSRPRHPWAAAAFRVHPVPSRSHLEVSSLMPSAETFSK